MSLDIHDAEDWDDRPLRITQNRIEFASPPTIATKAKMLCRAVLKHDMTALHILLQVEQVDVDLKFLGHTPLDRAFARLDGEMVKYLLDRDASLAKVSEVEYRGGLWLALITGHQQAIEAYANPVPNDADDKRFPDQETEIVCATCYGLCDGTTRCQKCITVRLRRVDQVRSLREWQEHRVHVMDFWVVVFRAGWIKTFLWIKKRFGAMFPGLEEFPKLGRRHFLLAEAAGKNQVESVQWILSEFGGKLLFQKWPAGRTPCNFVRKPLKIWLLQQPGCDEWIQDYGEIREFLSDFTHPHTGEIDFSSLDIGASAYKLCVKGLTLAWGRFGSWIDFRNNERITPFVIRAYRFSLCLYGRGLRNAATPSCACATDTACDKSLECFHCGNYEKAVVWLPESSTQIYNLAIELQPKMRVIVPFPSLFINALNAVVNDTQVQDLDEIRPRVPKEVYARIEAWVLPS